MDYDEEKGGSGEALVALGTLAMIAAPCVGVYKIYRHVHGNKKSDCFSCKGTYRNKDFVTLKICWDPPKIEKTYYYDVDALDALSLDMDDEFPKAGEKRKSYTAYEEDSNCCSIRLKSNWPTEYTVPDYFRQECDNYYKKKVCKDCARRIYDELINRAHVLVEKAKEQERLAAEKTKEEARLAAEKAKLELEKSKICCPRCNAKVLPAELSRPASSKLPWFWVAERYNNTKICPHCRKEILTFEHNRFHIAEEKSLKVITYPASYKGNIEIDYSSVKNDIKSRTYADRDCALNELKLRAFLGGYDVVFNCTYNRGVEEEEADSRHVASSNYIRGTHVYSVWSVTGSFAKKRI